MTERSESEFNEVGEANSKLIAADRRPIATAARLAAQDQKPVAWVCFDKVERKSYLVTNLEDAEDKQARGTVWDVTPLFTAPPPAAGWDITDDMVMAGARAMADLEDVGVDPLIVEHSKACLKAALRHNAPPDSGAGESEPIFGRTGFCGHSVMAAICEKCNPSVLPDHGGADAGVGWKKKFKGKTSGGAWIHTHPSVERAIVENHHGFTFDGVAYNSLDEAKTAALSKPAPVAANASAEARRCLRDAIEYIEMADNRLECDCEKCVDVARSYLVEAKEALSTHPHASDCDKQKECCDLAAKEPCPDCPHPVTICASTKSKGGQ